MFIDGRTLPPGTKVTADVCIIGAGPAGITLARRLANNRRSVVCIESGGLAPAMATQDLAKGKIIGLPYYPLETTRLRYFGGTSGHWGGYCRPLDPIDFEIRSWVPHSGWPIPYTAIADYYPAAQEICDLGEFDYTTTGWQLGATPPLPFSGSAVNTRLIQFSPPTRFGTKYQDEFAKSAQISVYLNSNVVNINANSTGNKIASLSIKTLAGNEFSAQARVYILAAGGIENAHLLLHSTNVLSKGLGNDNNLVGRFFCDHMQLDSAAILPLDKKASFELYSLASRHKPFQPVRAGGRPIGLMGYIALTPEAQRTGQILNYSANISETYWSDYFLHAERANNVTKSRWRVASDALGTVWDNLRDAGRMAIERLPGGTKSTFYKVITSQEQAPNPNSRVVLGDERDALGMRRASLNWQLTDLDRRTIAYSLKQLAKALGGSGIARLQLQRDFKIDEWPSYLQGSWHHCGTTRMSDSTAKGVVDPNCKVHGIANLYIAGSSLFPTNGNGNPTLSVVALSLRLAEHLRAAVDY